MFDFLTLSVVIDDKIFCVHGGTTHLVLSALRSSAQPSNALGLSPSIHSIDQIKVVDRFRGELCVYHAPFSHVDSANDQRFLTRVLWPTLYGQILTLRRRTLRFHRGRVHGPAPLCVCILALTSGFASGAGYTFGSGVVYKFLETNQMSHILRAHQLCMEGYTSLFDEHLSTVWSAPNYCYRCGNSASILEVGPGGSMFFNVFQAAPENERDGPSHQAAQNAGGKVRQALLYFSKACAHSMSALFSFSSLSPVYPVVSFLSGPSFRSPVLRCSCPAFFLVICASLSALLVMSFLFSPSTAARIFSVTYVMQHTRFRRVVLTDRPGRQDPQWHCRNYHNTGHLHIKKRTLRGRTVAACALWQVSPWIAVLRMFAGLLLPDTSVRRLVPPLVNRSPCVAQRVSRRREDGWTQGRPPDARSCPQLPSGFRASRMFGLSVPARSRDQH